MNGWMIAFFCWYATCFALALNKWSDGGGYIKVGAGDVFLGPSITLFLLYMGGAFTS